MQAGRHGRFRRVATRGIGARDPRFASLFDVGRETSRAATHVDARDGVLSDAGSTPAASTISKTTVVGIGVLLGVGASAWAARFVSTLVYGLEPRDPATLIGAAVTLAAVGALAGWLPARWASHIEPSRVLRDS